MEKETIKNIEKILKAVANRRRLAIVQYLKNEHEATVGDIADAIKLSFKATSKHLSILASADMVDRDQRGTQMHYRLSSSAPAVLKFLLSIL